MSMSETDICNLALTARLGQKEIVALTEQSVEARACAAVYGHVRALTQAEYNWRFCRKRVILAEQTNDRVGDWAYNYGRPADCLKMRYLLSRYGIFDPRERVRYEAEGDNIYSNEQYARAVYTIEIVDTTKFSPHFIQAFSWNLAAHICQKLEKTKDMLSTSLQGYGAALTIGRTFDSSEDGIFEQSADEAEPDWMRARQ